ncbi:MAG: hypothetical protein SFX73_09420 [Kofleriaceae bacterium]|nr:hypothetical protein [Kofleriaceae bacterium]
MRWLAWLGVLAACAPDRSVVPYDDDKCRGVVAGEVYKHACQHGRLGPYADVTATHDPDQTALVGGSQRALRVTLPPIEEDAMAISYFRYKPPRDGQHAVFAGDDGFPIDIAMLHDGTALDGVLLEQVQAFTPVRDCGGMTEVFGFELERNVEYVVQIGPTARTSLMIFVDHLPTFGTAWVLPCTPP